jgi:ABC-type phosphate/phosphonate transport system ATPase subunit
MLRVNEIPKMFFNKVEFKIKQISRMGIMTIEFSGKSNGTKELIAKINNSTFEIILHQGTKTEKIKFELMSLLNRGSLIFIKLNDLNITSSKAEIEVIVKESVIVKLPSNHIVAIFQDYRTSTWVPP